VFIELAVIRSHEFGVPMPWAGLQAWLRRLLHRPRVVGTGASMLATAELSARGKARPADVGPHASEAQRIERLERYVEHLDRDVDALHDRIDRTAEDVIVKAKAADDQLRQEIERREEERKTALGPSLRRQGIGATCVFVGLVLGMLGDLG
jgi:hypothetical protein